MLRHFSERSEAFRKARNTLYHALKPPELIRVRSGKHDFYVDPMRDHYVAKTILLDGGYELAEQRLFATYVKPGMLVLDVGANIGSYTLIAADRVTAAGRVLAFEPQPLNYRLLEKNVAQNGYGNVICLPLALGAGPATVELFLDPLNSGGASLRRNNIPNCRECVQVQVESLDAVTAREDAGRPVDVIKMDAQGAEGLILAGAERVLANPNIRIFMEFWPFGLRNFQTDALRLLEDFVRRGFFINVIEQGRLEKMSFEQILALCEERYGGQGYVDLFLSRKAA